MKTHDDDRDHITMINQAHKLMLHTCTWCLNPIPPDREIFAFGVKASELIDLSKLEGGFVSLDLTLTDKTVVAIVTSKSSEAKLKGYDLIFLTCSQTCAEDLKIALEAERVLYKD